MEPGRDVAVSVEGCRRIAEVRPSARRDGALQLPWTRRRGEERKEKMLQSVRILRDIASRREEDKKEDDDGQCPILPCERRLS